MEPLTQRKNILITNITNPFDPMHNREFKEAPQGLSLKECIDLVKDPLDGCYYVAAVNGSVVPEGTDYSLVYPQGNVVLCATPQGGGGKNPLRTILQIVVIVVAAAATWYLGGAGGIAMAGALGIETMAGMQMMALAAGLAIAVVGNMLVSALLPYDMGDISTGADQNQSATYSWGAPSNSNREGVVWPVLYGTMRISPPIIGKYIEVSGDKQYLNILYAIADHPITSIDQTSITLNGNTVTNGVDGVSWTYRLGSLNQTALPYFRDAITTKSVGSKVSTTWTVINVDGTQTEGLGVAFSLPYGLFYANDDGSLGNYTVSLDLEYKEINDTEWTNFFVNYLTITKAQSSAIRKVHKVHNLAPGSYQVRTRLHNGVAQSTSTRVKCDTYIDYVESIIYDDFAYPNSAVFALRVQATEKLSGGMPTLSMIATRSTVPVWTGSAYVNKPADNPAWASYDVLHNDNYGAGVSATRIEYADFAAWASNCDTHYSQPGVVSPTSFKCNYYIDVSMSLRKILNNIGQLGRGNTVQVGSNFTCFVDKLESLPAQSFIFNMSNINSKSFNVEYANLENRANAIDITFWDKDQDYKQRTIEIHAVDFDEATTEIKKTQITLYGCTSFAEALKHGYFALNNNRLLTITANFDADVDSLACMPWDVTEVQHDVTMWGEGGRILAATESTIVLDKEITCEVDKSYTLRVQSSASDTIAEYTLIPVEAETTGAQWTITTNFDPIPEQYDKWVITATGSATKLFRLIKTSRQSELTRKLVCLEYNPDIYDDSGTLQPPELPTLPVYEAHLRAIEVQEWNGSPNTAVHLSWTGLALSWNVFWKRADDTLYNYAGKTTTPFYRLTQIDLRADAYTFCVSHTEHQADGITVDLTLQGYSIIVPANTPLNLTANLRGQVIILEWDTPTDATVTGHTIYLNGTAICVNYTGTAYVYGNTLTAGVYNFTIAAVNKGGESEQTDAASITISVPATPAPSAAIVGENVVVSWTDCKTSLPIDYYLINSTKQGSAHRYIDRINWVGKKTYKIVAVDTSGNQSIAGTTSITVTGITTPTGIIATGFTYAIRLDLTYQTFADFDVVEIWSSETNDRGTALKVGETSAAAWTHSGLDLIDTRYYWTRIRNTYGTTGGWYPASATAGIECSTSTDPTDYLTILEGNLDSPLVSYLTDPIPEWSSIVTYAIDEMCYRNSVYYKAKISSLNKRPPNATYWDVVDDGVLDQWTIKLNSNGRVAGVGMMMDASGSSEFIVLSDKFQVVNPGDTMTPKAVFTVGTINGNSAVGISGDLIIDGSILARNIATGTITANKLSFNNLSGLNSSEGSKLSSIATGADVTLTAVNGGLTVTGGGITLSSGGAIKGGQTAYATGTGFYLGYSSSDYKMSIGSTSNYLTWDGTNLTIKGVIVMTSPDENVTTIANPGGCVYSSSLSVTGAIIITLPQSWTNTMIKMDVDVFDYYTSSGQGTSFTAKVGGYNYSGTQTWINEYAQIIGSIAANNRVRFGHDGTKCCIVIGETTSVWRHPKILVKNFQAGHTNYSVTQWNTGWTITIANSLTGYTFTGDISDALLDAKAILGQGALATEDSADWSTQISGTNKPADNADVTLTAVNGGLTVTGGGITLSSGGAIKGGQTAYATGTGFYLGYSGSAYKFSIGNTTQYLKWDGTNLSVSGAIKGGQTAYATGTGFYLGYSDSAYKLSIGNTTQYLKWDGTQLLVGGNIIATGNIEDNAATQVYGAFTASASIYLEGLSAQSISVTVPSNAPSAIVCIRVSMQIEKTAFNNGTTTIQIKRGSTVLTTYYLNEYFYGASGTTVYVMWSAEITDAPGVGTNTYSVFIDSDSGSYCAAAVANRSLVCTVHKR